MLIYDRMVASRPGRVAAKIRDCHEGGWRENATALVAALLRAERCVRCGRALLTDTAKARGVGSDCLSQIDGRIAWDEYLHELVDAARATEAAAS